MIAVLTAVMFTIFAYQSSKQPVEKNYTLEVNVDQPSQLDFACGKQINCTQESK